MPTFEQPPRRGPASGGSSARPDHRHQAVSAEEQAAAMSDPHPSWLKNWRRVRASLGVNGRSKRDSESAHELRDKIAHTPANTLAGLQAQAELIAELAWNDVVAATAHQLIVGLKRLQS